MLVDVAEQYEAGLIVIGTEGKQGAGPVLVGVIAEQLVRLAKCAVLAVAADYNAGAYRPLPGGPVMLAMERNEATSEALQPPCSLAETFHRTLIVVHARRPEEAVAFLNPAATTCRAIRHRERWPVSGAMHCEGRKAGRCDRGSNRAISTKRVGDRSETHQRNRRDRMGRHSRFWHGRGYRFSVFRHMQ